MNYEKNSSQISGVTCFVIERPYNYRFRHQSTPDRERLLFVKRGCVTVRSDEQVVTANQGEYISISAGLDTVAEYKGDDNVIIMLRFMGTLDSDNPGIRLFSRNREAATLMDSAVDNTMNTPYRLAAILYGVLHYLTQNDDLRISGDIKPVVRYINNNYKENRRVSEYAAMAYVSESHFRKLFLTATGMSPIEYRNSLRLKAAAELIDEGYTVYEAAEAVGFNSASFYCRLVASERRKSKENLHKNRK